MKLLKLHLIHPVMIDGSNLHTVSPGRGVAIARVPSGGFEVTDPRRTYWIPDTNVRAAEVEPAEGKKQAGTKKPEGEAPKPEGEKKAEAPKA